MSLDWLIVPLGLVIGGIAIFIVGMGYGMSKIMKQAIDRNKAQFNNKTREFEWL